MNRLYESIALLKDELKEYKQHLNYLLAIHADDEEINDCLFCIQDTEKRINFAIQDYEYDQNY